VAGIKNGAVVVQYYCIPIMMTSSVYRTLDLSIDWVVSGGEGWAGDLLQMQFGDPDGRTLVALTSTGSLWLSTASNSIEVGSKLIWEFAPKRYPEIS
jgi:hypothetical protein